MPSASDALDCHLIRCTVAPLSVLSNWEKQLEDHCTPGTLTSCVYYGANRGLSAEQLQEYDVVITTYQTVAGEFDNGNGTNAPAKKKKKLDKVLFDVPWKVRRKHQSWIC